MYHSTYYFYPFSRPVGPTDNEAHALKSVFLLFLTFPCAIPLCFPDSRMTTRRVCGALFLPALQAIESRLAKFEKALYPGHSLETFLTVPFIFLFFFLPGTPLIPVRPNSRVLLLTTLLISTLDPLTSPSSSFRSFQMPVTGKPTTLQGSPTIVPSPTAAGIVHIEPPSPKVEFPTAAQLDLNGSTTEASPRITASNSLSREGGERRRSKEAKIQFISPKSSTTHAAVSPMILSSDFPLGKVRLTAHVADKVTSYLPIPGAVEVESTDAGTPTATNNRFGSGGSATLLLKETRKLCIVALPRVHSQL
jgi:hypothetical protein